MPPLIHRDRDTCCWWLVQWPAGRPIARMATDYGDPRAEVRHLRVLDRLMRMCPETPQDGPGATNSTKHDSMYGRG